MGVLIFLLSFLMMFYGATLFVSAQTVMIQIVGVLTFGFGTINFGLAIIIDKMSKGK